MAFTYAVVRATATTPTVGTQVAGVLAADGHGYVYTPPVSGSGLGYPTTVRAIFSQPVPSNDSNTSDALFTFQLNNSSPYALPTDFTINGNTDWIITATGTA